MSPRGDDATRQCLIVLQTLAAASPADVATEVLLERAGYTAPDPESRRRALRRHVAALRDAGHDIEPVGEPGFTGGYRMTARDPVLHEALDDGERRALVEAMVAVRLGHLAEALGERATGTPGADATQVRVEVPAAVGVISDAVRRRAVLTFGYNGRPRAVHPYRLVSRSHEWQLDAFEPAAGKVKTFVLGRMDDVAAGGADGAYPPPPRLQISGDPIDWEIDPPVDAAVRVTAVHRAEALSTLGRLVDERPVTGDGAPLAPGTGGPAPDQASDAVLLSFRVTNWYVFQARLLALGPRATLVAPPALRSRLLQHLRTLAGHP
jgi:predicted DNA-binding transcriptional regulator YafY